jgi:hypothetical protein
MTMKAQHFLPMECSSSRLGFSTYSQRMKMWEMKEKGPGERVTREQKYESNPQPSQCLPIVTSEVGGTWGCWTPSCAFYPALLFPVFFREPGTSAPHPYQALLCELYSLLLEFVSRLETSVLTSAKLSTPCPIVLCGWELKIRIITVASIYWVSFVPFHKVTYQS